MQSQDLEEDGDAGELSLSQNTPKKRKADELVAVEQIIGGGSPSGASPPKKGAVDAEASDEAARKCTLCKKLKPMSDFDKKEYRCKKCRSLLIALCLLCLRRVGWGVGCQIPLMIV